MTTQHTPGPWNNKGGRICHSGSQDTEFKIAEVFGDNYKANGDLIAAAPEILVILRELTFIAESIAHLHDLERDILLKTEAARAAIAKAEGK